MTELDSFPVVLHVNEAGSGLCYDVSWKKTNVKSHQNVRENMQSVHSEFTTEDS